MASVVNSRRTSDLGDREAVVVFLIGMRVNRPWEFWRWMPVLAAMPRMILELAKDPSRGLLGRPRTFISGRVVMVVQYWNSFEDLERYARDPKAQHLPAWRAFNRRVRDNGSVGIFHETYRGTGRPGRGDTTRRRRNPGDDDRDPFNQCGHASGLIGRGS